MNAVLLYGLKDYCLTVSTVYVSRLLLDEIHSNAVFLLHESEDSYLGDELSIDTVLPFDSDFRESLFSVTKVLSAVLVPVATLWDGFSI